MTGTVSDISNHNTNSLTEGNLNLYYTNARSRGSISVNNSSGDGSLSYNSSTGVINYTGPSSSETRAHFTSGTGITITGGEISIPQSISTTSSVVFGKVTSNIVGQVSDISNHDTDSLSEGTSNLYHTTSRARSSVSVNDSGGDGYFMYDNSTGIFTYTGPSETEVRSHFSNGTGITLSNGEISIGQDVATTDDVTFNNLTLSGNLTINGTTTNIDTTNLVVEDPLIKLSKNNTEDSLDIGIYGVYGSSKYSGLFRDSSD